MSKSIENVSIFGEYKKQEDRVTAALLHVLNAGGQSIIEGLFGDLFDIRSINVISQSYQEKSNPDGEISCDCKYNIYIESKITPNAINPKQLANHLQLANPAENKYLCYITPDLTTPQELINNNNLVGWLSWNTVIDYFLGVLADGVGDRLLFFLINQLIQLIKHVVFKEKVVPIKDDQSKNLLNKEERVIIVGGSWGEWVASKYGFYTCQENRFFMPAKYIAFYHHNRIKYVFEIEEIKDSVDISEIPYIEELDYFKVKEVNYTHQKRKYMKLKLVYTCEPEIQNDKVDKNGNPCAFTQGQTYTTFTKITTATKTSEL